MFAGVMDLIFTHATLISAHVFLMFWLSTPQTCQCGYACTHKHAGGLGLVEAPSPLFLTVLRNPTPLQAVFPATLSNTYLVPPVSEGHRPLVPPGKVLYFKTSKRPQLRTL